MSERPAQAAADPALSIAGPAGRIEAALDLPEADAAPRPLLAIVCHPLPTEGGSMHNKVVTMAARALRELGATTLRFNFRGVGHSEGRFDDGAGELDDLRGVSLRAAAELGADAVVSIAPPVGRSWDFAGIVLPAARWLVIHGDADEIVEPGAVHGWVAALPHPPQLVRMPETSHFFHRKLMDLRGALKHGVRDWLPAPAA